MGHLQHIVYNHEFVGHFEATTRHRDEDRLRKLTELWKPTKRAPTSSLENGRTRFPQLPQALLVFVVNDVLKAIT